LSVLVVEDGKLSEIWPSMDAEDFSFVEENASSAFFQLGKGSRKAPETLYALHHPRFLLNGSFCQMVQSFMSVFR
jgi:metal-dependent amidase/aminoacylase/carboxypeptidase family protein